MKRIVVGISGASGAVYGIRLLETLSKLNVETHLVITEAAQKTILLETDWKVEEVKSLAKAAYDIGDLGANIASGSFQSEGMVVVPCSIKSLSAIANSFSENLLVRAADVMVKERRQLVIAVRETPLHRGHLELLLKVSDLGATVFPLIPGFYFQPKSIDDLINHMVGKVLDLFQINHNLFKRWGSSDLKRALEKKGGSS